MNFYEYVLKILSNKNSRGVKSKNFGLQARISYTEFKVVLSFAQTDQKKLVPHCPYSIFFWLIRSFSLSIKNQLRRIFLEH